MGKIDGIAIVRKGWEMSITSESILTGTAMRVPGEA